MEKRNEELTQEERNEKVDAYVANHPNAIVNPTEAEFMAHKSKSMEERVSSLGSVISRSILGENMQIGGRSVAADSRKFGDHQISVSEATEILSRERQGADREAEVGRREYRDISKVEQLMKGASGLEQPAEVADRAA